MRESVSKTFRREWKKKRERRTGLDSGDCPGNLQLLDSDQHGSTIPQPGSDDLFSSIRPLLASDSEGEDRRSETGNVLLVARVELPKNHDGFFSSRKEVGTIRSEGERGDGMCVPVKDGGRRPSFSLGLLDILIPLERSIPELDPSPCISSGKVILTRMERQSGQPFLGLQRLGESALEVSGLENVKGGGGDGNEVLSGGRQLKSDNGSGVSEAHTTGGRARGRSERRAGRGSGRRSAEGDGVDPSGKGRLLLILCASLGVILCWSSERDEELVGEGFMARCEEHRGGQIEGTEKFALVVVPYADGAVQMSYDELKVVVRVDEKGRGFARGRSGRGRGCRRVESERRES